MMKLYSFKSLLWKSVLAGQVMMVLLLIQSSNLSAQDDAGRPEGKRPERHDMSDLQGVSEAKAFHESLKTLSPEQKREAIRQ